MKFLILAAMGALVICPAAFAAAKVKAQPSASRRDMITVGSVLSPTYPGYRVVDHTRSNLPVAPAGYHYVRVGRHAYLRQTGTGVVAGVFRDVFR